MRILVLGGYGLIGSAIARRLINDDHKVTGLGRSRAIGNRLFPGIDWLEADIARLRTAEDWASFLENIDAVVNASGALQDGLRDQVRAVQETAIKALIDTCKTTGITRFVQISAVGASPDASTEFMASKAAADAYLQASSLSYALLRPGLVIARGAYGGTALVRAMAALPGIGVNPFPGSQIQTVGADEVAETVARWIDSPQPENCVADLVETSSHTVPALITAHRAWLGYPPARVQIPVPGLLTRIASLLADVCGWLGWRSPLRSTAVSVLKDGVTGRAEDAEAILGHPVRPLGETLALMPANAADRWHARLSLLYPLLIATLSAFWTVSGVIGLLRLDAATAVLAQTSAGPHAGLLAFSGGVADIALGLGVLVRPLSRFAAWGMTALTLAYLAGGTIFAPELWLDPLGPLVKSAALLLLPAVLLVMGDDR